MDAVAAPTAGYLEVIIGPMWSGKTSRLLDLHTQYTVCGVPVVLVNYIGDEARGVARGELRTHDGRRANCCSVKRIAGVPEEVIQRADAVLINEAQFFPDAVEGITRLVEELGKRVHAAGLDGDFMRRPFGDWLSLVPLSDEVVKKRAFCRGCKRQQAPFSHRIVESLDVQLIGAADAYQPLCRSCYRAAAKGPDTKPLEG